jgi:hypothetical protein
LLRLQLLLRRGHPRVVPSDLALQPALVRDLLRRQPRRTRLLLRNLRLQLDRVLLLLCGCCRNGRRLGAVCAD